MPQSPYDRKVEGLFSSGRIRKYPRNQLVHYQGDALTNIYLIKKGYIKAYTILDSGETRTLLILGPGDIFPIVFSLSLDWSNYYAKYFYQALSDVDLKSIESDKFKELIESSKDNLNIYMHYMSSSNQTLMSQLEVMKNKHSLDKLKLLLPFLVMKLGEKIGPGTYKLRIKLSHQEIADLSGVTRETTTTLVKSLEKAGILEQKQGFFIIHTGQIEDIFKEQLG